MSKRVFYRRGQRIELEQLDAVVALPVPAEQSDAMDAAALSAGVIADDAEGIVASDVNAFRRAGWLIVAAAQADAISDVPAGED